MGQVEGSIGPAGQAVTRGQGRGARVAGEHALQQVRVPFEPGGQTGRWYWEYELIQTETLWDVVRKAGKTSASFIWPVSVIQDHHAR